MNNTQNKFSAFPIYRQAFQNNALGSLTSSAQAAALPAAPASKLSNLGTAFRNA